MKIKFLIIIFLPFLTQCTYKKVENSINNNGKVVKHFKLLCQDPYLIQFVDSLGEIFSQEYYTGGILKNEYRIINGDSVCYEYTDTNDYYVRVFFASGDFNEYPMIDEKVYGIERYYSNNMLTERNLVLNDYIFATEIIKPVRENEIVSLTERDGQDSSIIKYTAYWKDHSFKTKTFQKFVSKGTYTTVGIYYSINIHERLDSLAGNFFLLTTPDTVKKGTEVPININVNHLSKSDFFIEFHYIGNNTFSNKIKPKKIYTSELNNLHIEFKTDNYKLGRNFIAGRVFLLNSDSSVYTSCIVYDDFIVIE